MKYSNLLLEKLQIFPNPFI